MGYKYINGLVNPKSVNKFLELVDLVAGSGKDVHNVFETANRFRTGRQMQLSVQAIQ